MSNLYPNTTNKYRLETDVWVIGLFFLEFKNRDLEQILRFLLKILSKILLFGLSDTIFFSILKSITDDKM